MVQINSLIGSFGKYHLWLSVMIFLSEFIVALHYEAINFLAPPVHYICPQNITCCDSPIYNKKDFTRTIVTEWNLICEKSWLKDFNQTVFHLGVLLGSLAFGLASDRFGRRRVLLVSSILEIFTGLMTSFMPEYWSFTVLRMFLGMAVGGVIVVSFVLLMEFIGSAYRDAISIIFYTSFSIGRIILAVFGYFIRDYVQLQLSISAASLVQLFYICMLAESPRWLLSKNKTFKALEVMECIAEINDLPKYEIRRQIELYQLNSLTIGREGQTKIHLFRNFYLRTHILIISFLWFVSGYCYFVLSQNISHLTKNIFINVITGGCVCLCACLLATPLMKFLYRKILIIVCNITSCFCFIIITFIPEGKGSIIMGCIGVLFCYMEFIVLYLYCSEIFPTVIRNTAIGISSMMGQFGAMIGPFVADLKSNWKWCAPIAFVVTLIIAVSLCEFLPETKEVELVISIEESGVLHRNTHRISQSQGSTVSEGK